MNKYNNIPRQATNLKRGLLILLSVFLFSACKKEAAPTTDKLQVNLIGIESLGANPIKQVQASTNKTSVKIAGSKTVISANGKQYETTLSLQNNAPEENAKPKTLKYAMQQAAHRAIQANSTLEILKPISYNLRLYTSQNSYYMYSYTTTPRNYSNIPLTADISYHWVAYSFNSASQNPPGLSVDAMKQPDTKTEVLADYGVLKLGPGGNSIDIVFKRKSAQIAIKFDATALNAEIISLEVSDNDNVFKVGNFQIGRSFVTQTSTTKQAVTSLLNTDFETVTGTPTNQVRIANYYTAGTDAITDFKLKVEECIIEKDGVRMNLPLDILTFPGTITPVVGKSTLLTVKIKELP